MEMKRAYEDMRSLLRKSMGECERLSEEVVRLGNELKSAKSESETSAGELKAVHSSLSDLKAKQIKHEREKQALEDELRRAKKEIEEVQERHESEGSTQELEMMRQQLVVALRQATAAVEASEQSEARCQV